MHNREVFGQTNGKPSAARCYLFEPDWARERNNINNHYYFSSFFLFLSLSLALTPVELYTKSTVLQTRIRLGKVERSAPSQIVQVTGSDSRYGLQNGELI